MLDQVIAYLKAKRIYEIALGVVLFIAFFIINKTLTLPIFMLPFLVFMGCRIFLKAKVKNENQPLVTAFALQFSQYLMILLAAFQNPFAKLIDVFVIFWGTNALWKKPSWRSGGVMMAYNAYLIFGYVMGIIKAIPANNLPNIRFAVLFIIVSAATIYFIYDGVKLILANQQENNQVLTKQNDTPGEEQSESKAQEQDAEKQDLQ